MGNDNLRLIPIPSRHVDFAWSDGASKLEEACSEECTIDQLKMVISRDERTLVRMDDDTGTVGWAVFKVEQFPNLRAFHVTNLVARRAHFERFFGCVKAMAKDLGCSRIRCSAQPALARLYEAKLGFEPIYTTLEARV